MKGCDLFLGFLAGALAMVFGFGLLRLNKDISPLVVVSQETRDAVSFQTALADEAAKALVSEREKCADLKKQMDSLQSRAHDDEKSMANLERTLVAEQEKSAVLLEQVKRTLAAEQEKSAMLLEQVENLQGQANDIKDVVAVLEKALLDMVSDAGKVQGKQSKENEAVLNWAVDLIVRLARTGDPKYARFQYIYGCCVENGVTMKKSIERAVGWYRLAAKNGDVDAQAALRRLGHLD